MDFPPWLYRTLVTCYALLVLASCAIAYRQHGLTWPRTDWIGRPITARGEP